MTNYATYPAATVLVSSVLLAAILAESPHAIGQSPPPLPCGVDLDAQAIAQAVPSLRPAFSDRDVAWSPVPYGGNFNPCATLSTVLVTIQSASGSSPDHALFFHQGEYVGTATWIPYPFTSLDSSLTTNDTVVLLYKDGRQVCTACPGPMTTVRYQWQGDHVEMLDPPPPTP